MKKVMIAEDDLFMADMLEEVLVTAGYKVCGIARTVNEGVELCERHRPDLAVMDIRLADGLGTTIAARLKYLGPMGVLYATGNVANFRLTRADGEACLNKPYTSDDIVSALRVVEQMAGSGTVSGPIPRNLQILSGPTLKINTSDGENGEVARLRRQQAALALFGSFALGEADLGKVLTEAARVCAEGLGVPFCKVCRYRSDEGDLLVEAGVGWDEGVIGRVVSPANESSPQGRAFITGQPVVCDDLASDASFVLPAFYADHGIISTVDVVIRVAGEPYGILEVDSPVQHNYDEHDVNFLTGFANILAEAVNTSKRNAAIRSAADRMRAMIVEKDRLLAAKSDLLEEKAVLARELQHRVRNNLQLVYAMLSRQTVGANGAAQDGIGAIARRVMALSQVYEHLLGTGLSRTIEFSTYLSSLCSNFAALERHLHPLVELTCQTEPVVLDLDRVTSLGLVISELMANSYAHAFPGGKGSISVRLSPGHTGDETTLVFADDGVGFSEHSPHKRHGVGLVMRLIEQIGGSAAVRSDHGTEWTLKFPTSRVPKASDDTREARPADTAKG
jgi:two-component sensor histidine kinase/CheY-like chemotaxis protein